MIEWSDHVYPMEPNERFVCPRFQFLYNSNKNNNDDKIKNSGDRNNSN